ncbi:ABC transporter ATP-binding protein [Pedobacter sp. SD-b]|uniref:ABC transporter ATP-binding protein n=1 Tax=Pedobacter segetis TaxID=2793069 RepID=A0ABS1BGV8_9SPHI|nr:ABC transporter ATP-binding protein [Pedobacter segetis]MBK0382082.1 ABC transporter ATP-binding protein [Pedobacter segetis]
MSTVIKVENLSKQYRLGSIGTGSISHDLNRWWHTVRGKENPYLKIGETNDRSTKGNSEYVWSLRDLNFEIEQGDAVGIIGRNGAGKSTLLKILSRVTGPTTGSVKVRGRIASLLEVGTGFHPELSGRENIFLNGAILGMRKHEIQRKFDEIVDFSGVERYIDTPVKRYSSGMYVRLAFAVAAHLESEILIVDEVLAVGDAEFQKKCLGKMQDVNAGEGRTVLFVSHNMNAVNRLCNKGITLHNGGISFEGGIESAVKEYLNLNFSSKKSAIDFEKKVDAEVQLVKAALVKNGSKLDGTILTEDELIIKIDYAVNIPIKQLHLSMFLKNERDEVVFFSDITDHYGKYLKINPGNYQVSLKIPNNILVPSSYTVSFGCVNRDTLKTYHQTDALFFEQIELSQFRFQRPGYLNFPLKWDLKNIEE